MRTDVYQKLRAITAWFGSVCLHRDAQQALETPASQLLPLSLPI
jgi:hypothetical protein